MSGAGVMPGRALGRVLTLLLLAWLSPARAATVVDDTGATVEVPRPVRRIISLSPHATELLFSAGAGPYVVGAVRGSDYPPAAATLPDVGDAHSLDMERIVTLAPDLVVAWQSGNSTTALARLRELGYPVYVSEPASLSRIAATMRALGTLAGTSDVADAAADTFERRYRSLQQRHAGSSTVRIFYQIWHDPIFTVGNRHIISEIIRLCGGTNVFASLKVLAGEVNLESVLAAAPEVIVGSGADAARPPWLDTWLQWPDLPAVRDDNLAFIPPDLIQRHTGRILDGADMMCDILERARARP